MIFFKRIDIFSISLVLLPSTYGCNIDTDCTKTPLSSDDKSWMEFADLGDTILFSYEKNIDTFIVTDKHTKWGVCNRFELGEGQNEKGIIGVNRFQKGKLNVEGYKLGFNVGVVTSTEPRSYKSIFAFNLQTERLKDFNELKDTTINIPSLSKSIRTLKITDGSETSDSGIYPKISEFYWNKELGLVCYKMRSGEVFYYSKKY